MKARCHVQQLFALERTKYIHNVSSIRNEESSIELPESENQADGYFEFRFGYTTYTTE